MIQANKSNETFSTGIDTALIQGYTAKLQGLLQNIQQTHTAIDQILHTTNNPIFLKVREGEAAMSTLTGVEETSRNSAVPNPQSLQVCGPLVPLSPLSPHIEN